MSVICKAITRNELSRHCQRRTRGVELTLELIEGLLLQLSSSFATDSTDEPVLNDKIVTIWEEEKKHVKCIQSPDGIMLYTITGHITNSGGLTASVSYARGTTSLEPFHLHLAGYTDVGINVLTCIIIVVRFIPGSSASNIHLSGIPAGGSVKVEPGMDTGSCTAPRLPTERSSTLRWPPRLI